MSVIYKIMVLNEVTVCSMADDGYQLVEGCAA
jgi:hypothetical protein